MRTARVYAIEGERLRSPLGGASPRALPANTGSRLQPKGSLHQAPPAPHGIWRRLGRLKPPRTAGQRRLPPGQGRGEARVRTPQQTSEVLRRQEFKDVLADADAYGVDFRTPFNLTPLMCAAIQGNAGLVKALLDKGANPDLSDNHGQTALHHALRRAYTTPDFASARLGDISTSASARERERQGAGPSGQDRRPHRRVFPVPLHNGAALAQVRRSRVHRG